jgi:hypothetical protein
MTNSHQTPRFVNSGGSQRFDVFGASMLYKATADDTRGAYSLAIETTLPHAGLPLHVRPCDLNRGVTMRQGLPRRRVRA